VTRFRAPGKAFLWGEFIALRGGPAAVTAVGRYVDATWTQSDSEGWSIESSLYPTRVTSLPELLDAQPRGDAICAVVQTLNQAGESLASSGTLSVDSSALASSEHSPVGLGSSAATTAAVTSVLLGSGERVVDLAVAAHRLFQGGLGSGYDVLSACLGGTRAIERTEAGLVSRVIDLPPELRILLVAGSTAPKTPSVIEALRRAGPATESILAELEGISRELDASCQKGGASQVIAGIRDFALAEERLGEAIGVEIVPHSVRSLSRAIEPLAATCKPSGAGGDGLVVVACQSEQERTVVESILEAGFRVVEAELGVSPL